MMRKLAILFIKFFCSAVLCAQQNDKPNVVLFLTDDQGTLDANCYGSKDLYTPNMDRLANNGILFTQAYSYHVCCPTRAALLTGRAAHRTGVYSWTQGDAKAEKGINMNLDEVTIAEILKEQGYKTGLFGKWHLGADMEHGPTSQGFDYFYGHRGGFIDNYNHHFLHGEGFHDLYKNKKEIFKSGKYFPDMMTKEAIRFINKNKKSPLFLYIAFNIPHYPEQSDSKFDQLYAELKEPRRSYAKMISTVDDRMGQIMNHLKKLGLFENTIFIFLSDNGHSCEVFQITVENHKSGLPKGHEYGAKGGGGNTGKWYGKKGTYFEGGVRVPFIISYPKKLPSELIRDQIVREADILPTICAIVDAPLPDKRMDGASLLPIILDNANTHHDALHWAWDKSWAVREGNWKLIMNGWNRPCRAEGENWKNIRLESPYLTKLSGDDPERKNLASENPDIVKKLTKLHEEWIGDVRKK